MIKKKTSRRQEECFEDIPIVIPKKEKKVKRFDPESRLRDRDFVAKALFEALSDGDEEAALEIIIAYVKAVGKTEIAKHENIATSTVYHALSGRGNPTLRTVAKVLHAASH
jgi:probable addiction module antidote protein